MEIVQRKRNEKSHWVGISDRDSTLPIHKYTLWLLCNLFTLHNFMQFTCAESHYVQEEGEEEKMVKDTQSSQLAIRKTLGICLKNTPHMELNTK